MKCGVESVECGVWSVECGVESVECTNGRFKSLPSVLSHGRVSVSAWKRCLRVKS